MIPTPLETAILNARGLASGLGALAIIQDLLQKGEEAALGVQDRDLPHDVRTQALKDARHVNTTLMLCAIAQEAVGISA
jgi:hypothetical protein